jgi:hypothetical protein
MSGIKLMKSFLKKVLPKKWKILYKEEFQRKKAFKIKDHDSEKVFNEIYNHNIWSSRESVSGMGSENRYTQHVKSELENLLTTLNIKTFTDIPCGDFNWMQHLNLSKVQYLGGDIVQDLIDNNNVLYKSSNINFKFIDITSSTIPKSDLILCRDCLVHLSFKEIYKAIVNIKKSKSTYLLTTSFVNIKLNKDIVTGQWRSLNLVKTPFNFGKPILTIIEKSSEKYTNKALCLWKIEDIKISKVSFYIKSSILYRMLFF